MHLNRLLYSNTELGITKYISSRQVVARSIPELSLFRQNLQTKLQNVTDISITELELELKYLLHVMVEDKYDVELLHNTLQSLIVKRATYVGDKYRFDSVILRTFHYLSMPDAAIRVSSYRINRGSMFHEALKFILTHLNNFS